MPAAGSSCRLQTERVKSISGIAKPNHSSSIQEGPEGVLIAFSLLMHLFSEEAGEG